MTAQPDPSLETHAMSTVGDASNSRAARTASTKVGLNRHLCLDGPTLNNGARLVARLVLAWIFIYHGSGTLFGWFNGAGLSRTATFFGITAHLHPSMLFAVTNGLIEFCGGVALIPGLLSRLAALGLVVDMIVAMVTVSDRNGIVGGAHGSGYEINLALAGLALIIGALGPGKWSADAWVVPVIEKKVASWRSHGSRTKSAPFAKESNQ